MRNCIFVAIVLALFVCVGTASADQTGAIPQDALAEMGLGDLQPMTDEAAMEVRGSGFAFVIGGGFTPFPAFDFDYSFRPNRAATITIVGFSFPTNSVVIVEAYALTKWR